MPKLKKIFSPRLALEPEEALVFEPHEFSGEVSFIEREPRIILTEDVHDHIWHLVNQSSGEVGWFGTVIGQGGDYVIDEIFVCRQKVNNVYNSITKDGLSDLAQMLRQRPDGNEVRKRLRFWGHSHGDLDTDASPKDESQAMKFKKLSHPYFIRGIFNRLGRAQFSIFYFGAGIRIDDAPWQLKRSISPAWKGVVKRELAEKVSPLESGGRRRGVVASSSRYPGGSVDPIDDTDVSRIEDDVSPIDFEPYGFNPVIPGLGRIKGE